jgi:hypothetical protein
MNNYFRQIGGSIGAALFGSIFINRLTPEIAHHLPPGAKLPNSGAESLTPAVVHHLPGQLKDVIVNAYAHTLPPVFWVFVPMLAVGFVLAFFLPERPLRSGAAPEQVKAEEPAVDAVSR